MTEPRARAVDDPCRPPEIRGGREPTGPRAGLAAEGAAFGIIDRVSHGTQRGLIDGRVVTEV